MESLIGYNSRNWRTVQAKEFADALFSASSLGTVSAKPVPRYRYVNGEIRILSRKFEEDAGADVKDIGGAAHLKSHGFRVTFEDTGVRHTIFDRYQSFEHSARMASLEGYLSETLTCIAVEVKEVSRSVDSQIAILRDLLRPRALSQRSPSAQCLQTPGDPPEQVLPVFASRLFLKHFLISLAQIRHTCPTQAGSRAADSDGGLHN